MTLGDKQIRDASQEWLSWAWDQATKLDPLQGPLSTPDEPEATPEKTRPYLNWSGIGGDQP